MLGQSRRTRVPALQGGFGERANRGLRVGVPAFLAGDVRLLHGDVALPRRLLGLDFGLGAFGRGLLAPGFGTPKPLLPMPRSP